MPSTPQMRKANEKNAKNVTKRGNVIKTSKTDDKYPVSPELIVSSKYSHLAIKQNVILFLLPGPLCLRGDWLCRVPNHPGCLDVWPLEDLPYVQTAYSISHLFRGLEKIQTCI